MLSFINRVGKFVGVQGAIGVASAAAGVASHQLFIQDRGHRIDPIMSARISKSTTEPIPIRSGESPQGGLPTFCAIIGGAILIGLRAAKLSQDRDTVSNSLANIEQLPARTELQDAMMRAGLSVNDGATVVKQLPDRIWKPLGLKLATVFIYNGKSLIKHPTAAVNLVLLKPDLAYSFLKRVARRPDTAQFSPAVLAIQNAVEGTLLKDEFGIRMREPWKMKYEISRWDTALKNAGGDGLPESYELFNQIAELPYHESNLAASANTMLIGIEKSYLVLSTQLDRIAKLVTPLHNSANQELVKGICRNLQRRLREIAGNSENFPLLPTEGLEKWDFLLSVSGTAREEAFKTAIDACQP